MQARLNDDEVIEAEVAKHGMPATSKDVPLTKYDPTVEALAAVFDKLNEVVGAIYASAGAKQKPRMKPYPRPKTGYDRIESKAVDDQFLTMLDQLAPHEVDRVAKMMGRE